jgi:transmembrane sensor
MNTEHAIDERARDWFVRLADPDASEADWLAFQDWLEADDAHRGAYDRVEQLWVALDEVPRSAIPANDETPGIRRRSRPRWLYPAVGMAAAVALAVGVWPMLNGGEMQVYRTASDPRTVVLSDGSQIFINRHSDVSVRMTRGRREVTLADGEAAFDVTHNASRPFVITAGDHSVRVLGTAFNVLNHDDRFSVGVERGVVAVTPARGAATLQLTAGQRVDQVGGRQVVRSHIDPVDASTWRRGVLVYRNASVAEVGEDLSRYLDKPVNVSASARTLRFTGVLQVGDEGIMLDQLKELVPVDVSRAETGLGLTWRGAD